MSECEVIEHPPARCTPRSYPKQFLTFTRPITTPDLENDSYLKKLFHPDLQAPSYKPGDISRPAEIRASSLASIQDNNKQRQPINKLYPSSNSSDAENSALTSGTSSPYVISPITPVSENNYRQYEGSDRMKARPLDCLPTDDSETNHYQEHKDPERNKLKVCFYNNTSELQVEGEPRSKNPDETNNHPNIDTNDVATQDLHHLEGTRTSSCPDQQYETATQPELGCMEPANSSLDASRLEQRLGLVDIPKSVPTTTTVSTDSSFIDRIDKTFFVARSEEIKPPTEVMKKWREMIKPLLTNDLIAILKTLPTSIPARKSHCDFDICMSGYANKRASIVNLQPTVLIRCVSRRCAKVLRAAVEDLSYLKNFHEAVVEVRLGAPELAALDCDEYENSTSKSHRISAPGTETPVGNNLRLKVEIERKSQGIFTLGRTLRITYCDASRGLYERRSILGGIVLVRKGNTRRLYGLTVAHVFMQLFQDIAARNASSDNVSSNDFSSDDFSDDDSEHSESDNEQNANFDEERSYLEREEDIKPKQNSTQTTTGHRKLLDYANSESIQAIHSARFNNYSLSRDENGLFSRTDRSLETVMGSSDFALLELQSLELRRQTIHDWLTIVSADDRTCDLISQTISSSELIPKQPVMIGLGSSSVGWGIILEENSTFMGRDFVLQTKKIRTTAPLSRGSSGAWVVYPGASGNALCGIIIAVSPNESYAHMLPIDSVLASIQASLPPGTEISLPTYSDIPLSDKADAPESFLSKFRRYNRSRSLRSRARTSPSLRPLTWLAGIIPFVLSGPLLLFRGFKKINSSMKRHPDCLFMRILGYWKAISILSLPWIAVSAFVSVATRMHKSETHNMSKVFWLSGSLSIFMLLSVWVFIAQVYHRIRMRKTIGRLVFVPTSAELAYFDWREAMNKTLLSFAALNGENGLITVEDEYRELNLNLKGILRGSGCEYELRAQRKDTETAGFLTDPLDCSYSLESGMRWKDHSSLLRS